MSEGRPGTEYHFMRRNEKEFDSQNAQIRSSEGYRQPMIPTPSQHSFNQPQRKIKLALAKQLLTKDSMNRYEPNVEKLFAFSIPLDIHKIQDKLTSELDDIEQVKLRLAYPDATNNSNWFLKPDLIGHPKLAVSELSHRKMLHMRTEEAKFVMRSLCGTSEYYSRFKEELKSRNLAPVLSKKLIKRQSMFAGKRNLPTVFKTTNEQKITTFKKPQRQISPTKQSQMADSILQSECDVVMIQDSILVDTPRFELDLKSSRVEQQCNKHRQSWSRQNDAIFSQRKATDFKRKFKSPDRPDTLIDLSGKFTPRESDTLSSFYKTQLPDDTRKQLKNIYSKRFDVIIKTERHRFNPIEGAHDFRGTLRNSNQVMLELSRYGKNKIWVTKPQTARNDKDI